MNLDDIRTVLAVYQYRSWTEAAYLTFQSLSSVSKCVSRVEKEIGGKLFVRSRKGMKTTALGEKVIPMLIEMSGSVAETIRDSRELLSSDKEASEISIGYTPLLGTVGENEILLRYKIQNPDILIYQVKRYTNHLQQLVSDRYIDAAFLFYISDSDMSERWKNMNDNLGLIKIMEKRGTRIAMSSDHPLASHQSVHISDFNDDVFIFNTAPQHYTPVGNYTRFIFNSEKRFIPRERTVRMDFLNRSMLISAIREGYGVCPVACDPPQEEIEGISFVTDADSSVCSCAYLCWHTENSNPSLDRLIETAADYAKEKGIKQ